MSKKIVISGTEYPCKKISRIVVKNKQAALIRNKEMFLFSRGIVVVTCGGELMKYYVSKEDNEIGILFYDASINNEQRIFFSDEVLNSKWETVFVYLFDEDGVYVLFAKSSVMNTSGVLYDGGNSPLTRQMALNIAGLIQPSLVREIIDDIELMSTDEASLLEEGR